MLYAVLEQALVTGSVANCAEVLVKYPEIDIEDLAAELRMFHRNRKADSVATCVALIKNMLPEVRAEFPNVTELIRNVLVPPASSVQAERSFSALRRLKTWLRSTMSESRLNSVAVCHVHRSTMDATDTVHLMTDFVSRPEIRKGLFGQFVSAASARNCDA